jgi:uncharacterized ferritin-like protein (DUF455 family)
MGETLEDKLLVVDKIEFDKFDLFDVPKLPARESKIRFSGLNLKFPRGHFHEIEKKAVALHSFANHELLAIEMMACALVIYPHHTEELRRFKLGVINSLKDEQKHFKLYRDRLNDIGYDFGDFVLNDFFWKYMDKLKTPSHYLSVMALTFEAANLDFAHFYQHVFQELGDDKTAGILKTVLDDEISHVHLGVTYLNKWKQDKDLWSYYLETLPYPLTPARSKGKAFVEHVRLKAKMDQEFIDKVKNYDDDFGVTNRKEWKKK